MVSIQRARGRAEWRVLAGVMLCWGGAAWGQSVEETVEELATEAVEEVAAERELAAEEGLGAERAALRHSREVFKDVETAALAEQCDESLLMFRELMLDSRAAEAAGANAVVGRLRAEYGGFNELFGREDLWVWLRERYATAGERIGPERETEGVVRASFQLMAWSQLVGQVGALDAQWAGHERELVAAQVKAVAAYRDYLAGCSEETLKWWQEEGPFMPEPIEVVEAAVRLIEREDAAAAGAIEAGLASQARGGDGAWLQDWLAGAAVLIEAEYLAAGGEAELVLSE